MMVFAAAPVFAKTMQVDFGSADASGILNGSYWNVWNPGNNTVLLDADGYTSTGWNLNSTTAAATNDRTSNDYVASYATYGAPAPFNHDNIVSDALNLTPTQGTRNVRLSNLNPANTYNFQIYGAREAIQTRVTNYTVLGANSGNGSLLTSGNGSGTGGATYNNAYILSINGISPDSSGVVIVEYSVGSGDFGYLNAMVVSEVVAPTPTPTPTPTPAPPKKKLVIAGSSVPNGYGAYSAGTYTNDFDQDPAENNTFGLYGYAGRLRLLLTNPDNQTNPNDSSTDWVVENVSIGGNDTPKLLARFDPDITRQYTSPKIPGTEPDYVFIGLSMGNEGLVYGDPEQTFASFKTGMLELIQRCRDRGYYPVVASVYPHGLYTSLKYGYVKRMNLLMQTWGVPVINLLGAIDDGNGRWADGTQFVNRIGNGTEKEDPAHPNIIGHEEMFLAIPPSLFDAIEFGKTTVPAFPTGAGFARLASLPGETSSMVFTPAHTMHSFTHSFQVRSNASGTVAAVRTANAPRFLVDFGPANDEQGRAAPNPDAFGRYWNNWRPQPGGSNTIPAGTSLPDLIAADNSPTSVGLEITQAFSGSDGRSAGGLTPPAATLLGQLATGNATEDYFFDNDDNAAFKLTGLDPGRKYTLRFFATRENAATAQTRFTVTGGLPYSPFCNVVTSGPRVAKDGLGNSNDHLLGIISSMPPNVNGEISVSLLSDNSTEAYLGLMEVSVDGSSPRQGTIELRNGSIAYVSPDGREITAPVDGDGGCWHDIALSHRYARQETLLYVDGVLAGTLCENLLPDSFVLGGPAGPGRADAPATADYQDWCVNRAAWTDEEAAAQHRGELQHASMEILAPLDDPSFTAQTSAKNSAQSLSEPIVRSAGWTSGTITTPPNPLAATSFGRDSVELAWHDNHTGESGYTIQRRLARTSSPWENAGTTAANATGFMDTGLIPGAWYEYRVAAIEGLLRGAWSNPAEMAVGISGKSYGEWSADFFQLPRKTYRIDFNTGTADYGGETWNRLSSPHPGGPLALADSGGDTSAGYKLTVTGEFDSFDRGNGAPLAGFPSDPQGTCFVVSAQTQPGGAQLILSGLNRSSNFNIQLFGRISPATPGADHRGRFTIQGAGTAATFEKNIADNSQLFGASLPPDDAGNIVIDLGAPDFPTGPVETGLSFMVVEEVPGQKFETFLLNFDGNSTTTSYPSGLAWNRIASLTDTTVRTLANTGNSTSGNVTFQLATPFETARVGSSLPGGFDDDAERTMFKAFNAGSTFVLGGLDPATPYDLTFLSHRGTVVANFDYTANCTVTGANATSLVVDGASGLATTMPAILPSPQGTISFKIAAGPGSGTDFPVLNLLSLTPSHDAAEADAGSDPDGDGMDNLAEYAMGLDPLVADAAPPALDDLALDLGNGRIEFSHTRAAAARDAGWILESSTNLADTGGWQIDQSSTQRILSRQGGMETVRHSSAIGAEPRRFFRMRLAPELQP